MKSRRFEACIVLALALILSSRRLLIAPDDQNYLLNFEGYVTMLGDDWWNILLQEPLWYGYILAMSELFEPEVSLRITVFAMTVLFLWSSFRISNGLPWFLMLCFCLDGVLATQMFYNQLRQGFAVALFIGLVALRTNLALAAALSSMAHSSMLTVIPAAVVAQLIIRSRALGSIVLACSVVLLGTYFGDIVSIDLGRREDVYERVAALSLPFKLFVFGVFALVVGLVQPASDDAQAQRLRVLTIIHVVMALTLATVHEAAGRLLYIPQAIAPLLIIRSKPGARRQIAVGVWLLVTIFNFLHVSWRGNFDQETPVGRWLLILGLS